jgi:uncharacterized membrane protein YphA (DoxX/SURF4 family)
MFIAAATASVSLAALLMYSAVRKLSHSDEVVHSYARAGVPESSLNTLAAILIAGAVGLVVGIWWRPLGIAAAACLVVYFATACRFHIRAPDTRHLPTPVTMAVLAVTSLVLRIATS